MEDNIFVWIIKTQAKKEDLIKIDFNIYTSEHIYFHILESLKSRFDKTTCEIFKFNTEFYQETKLNPPLLLHIKQVIKLKSSMPNERHICNLTPAEYYAPEKGFILASKSTYRPPSSL